MSDAPAAEELAAAIAGVRPDLAGGKLHLLTEGWDSIAAEIGGFIFKFPRDEEAAEALRREARLLAMLRGRVAMPIPDMCLHELPRLFSEHRKLAGEMIETPQYERLDEARRQVMAHRLAKFYAQLHAIPLAEARAAGAQPIDTTVDAEAIAKNAREILPGSMRGFVEDVLNAYQAFGPDEAILGYFDGHGWNMAFDHALGALNGLYDFADAGIGPLHQEFAYSNFISPDLTLRIIDGYEQLTARVIDRRRVMLFTAVQRLGELPHDVKPREWFLRNLLDWHEWLGRNPAFGP